ncbi:hypothetical protein A0H81_02451 [Grifola frondosa]|uniref:Uncharacterized protein n=1 Tax=Grifola frondosa TaxID=5627 RepID=A0A1C7ML65_GRIFR|nr:hypothetical protein A0H81_02451 [Grifola frondosa]
MFLNHRSSPATHRTVCEALISSSAANPDLLDSVTRTNDAHALFMSTLWMTFWISEESSGGRTQQLFLALHKLENF